MLVFIVLGTVMLLIMFAVGQLFPTKVFLGPTATRQKVLKFYGVPALVGFVGLMVLGPNQNAPASAGSVSVVQPATQVSKQIAEENGRFKTIDFNGFALPGRLTDAKATGFTDCEADYYGYKCARLMPTQLIGITSRSASLTMDGRDYFSILYLVPEKHAGDVRKIPSEELSYGEVALIFAKPEYDEICVEKHTAKHGYGRPVSCVTNKDTIAHVTQALHDAGWILARSKGGYSYYVRSGEPVEITVKDDVVRVGRVSAETVQEFVARDAERRESQQAAETNAARVIEQMKK